MNKYHHMNMMKIMLILMELPLILIKEIVYRICFIKQISQKHIVMKILI